ncbi:hypothetical protein M3699_26875 [Peribacillus simplex]|uniref:hypothetical protein n=1 Tax=Peribacillus simplex TaxID=1478 RepID=UPI00203FB936|nr:hypothetical protein [Peribacillus simplex]MCM3677313.1 hypothetical protein [Peribacillus simplex]
MKKILRFSWISMLMLTLFLTGCGVNDDQAATYNKDTEKAEEIKDYTVTDDTGKKMKFEKTPKKSFHFSQAIRKFYLPLNRVIKSLA